MSTPAKTKSHSLLTFIRQLFNYDNNYIIPEDDITKFKNIMHNYIHVQNMSPGQIKKKHNFKYSNFAVFLKDCVGVNIKNHRDATNIFLIKNGLMPTDRKFRYQKDCKFQFNPYEYTNISGYKLLTTLGIYHPTTNPKGVCRDHIISVEYGWRNKIKPNIISHPANCQHITNTDNSKKGSAIGMNIDDLHKRIASWSDSQQPINFNIYKQLPKSISHRKKLSEANKQFINTTNGIINRRIRKTDIIEKGFWRS